MDRRVLLVSLILFAGGATGVGVAVFAFVGLDDATTDAEVVWESSPAAGDDGSGAVVATVDGDPLILQPAIAESDDDADDAPDDDGGGMTGDADDEVTGDADDGDEASLRALDADGDVAWSTAVPGDVPSDGTSDLIVADVDGDPVVAFTTVTGSLVVLDAADGTERFSTSVGTGAAITPAAVDLTDDGMPAFVAVDDGGTVVAVDETGDGIFETDLDGDGALRPLAVAGDPDDGTSSDGGDDSRTLTDAGVAVLTEGTGAQHVTVVDAAGDVVWSEQPDGTTLSWNAADSRRGGILALGGTDGTLKTLEVSDGSPRYDVGLQDVPVDVGDADAGRIHVGGIGDVWAVDLLDGEVVWKQQYGGEVRVNEPAVGDVTGDGTAEAVAVNRDGGLLAMNRNGEAVVRGDAGSVVVYARPLFADVTGDGTDEIVVVTDDGTVMALRS